MSNTKVWVLKAGLSGFNAHGQAITLQPGLPGWMTAKNAEAAHKEGSVQIMVGLRPQDLKTPVIEQPEPEPPKRRRRGTYRTTKMRPEENGDL